MMKKRTFQILKINRAVLLFFMIFSLCYCSYSGAGNGDDQLRKTVKFPIDFCAIELPNCKDENVWPQNMGKIKIFKKKWYYQNGQLQGFQAIYEDGTLAEIGYRNDGIKGYEIYRKENWDKKELNNKHIDHSKNENLIGIRIQYFPDSSYDQSYTGEHPCMVIYVFRDGKKHQLEFYSDGSKKADFWSDQEYDVLIFTD